MPGQKPQRGRPPLADVGLLRERAIGILLRDGYPNVSMARLADEVGLSVRTLHRYFPTKADIVWGGTEAALDLLRRHLDETDADLPILEAIIVAVVGVFSEDTDEPSLSRARLRIIATTPDLRSTRPETYHGWRDETIAFIARRTGASVHDVSARAAGAAVQTAITESLTCWAADDSGESLADTVTCALLGLGALAAPPGRSTAG
ncbi:acyl-CoA-like ligand-binding transcription factor [Streptomyces paludis]|uniref:TetR family transcriptional regulator n=1 Tax=Streptomyces paludis TaxID=2282738 RepID=A0A345HZ96_9ACTN|nr:TetR family transcriptional regulator [Streptomyces paludis]AXG82020.1 TetR family transcriptional regulator [Streptomyces paludis]